MHIVQKDDANRETQIRLEPTPDLPDEALPVEPQKTPHIHLDQENIVVLDLEHFLDNQINPMHFFKPLTMVACLIAPPETTD